MPTLPVLKPPVGKLPVKLNPLAAGASPVKKPADASGALQAVVKRATSLAKAGSQDSKERQRSSAGEKNGLGYAVSEDNHRTGAEAFATLDKYLKKAGLNEFQSHFFGRLIGAGYSQSQLRHITKQGCAQFSGTVATELLDGWQKCAGPKWLKWLKPGGGGLSNTLSAAGGGVAGLAGGYGANELFRGAPGPGGAPGPVGAAQLEAARVAAAKKREADELAAKGQKSTDWLQPLLMAGLGAGGGYALGKTPGAVLGGISAPLLYMLAQRGMTSADPAAPADAAAKATADAAAKATADAAAKATADAAAAAKGPGATTSP